jgi:hypothetical protein
MSCSNLSVIHLCEGSSNCCLTAVANGRSTYPPISSPSMTDEMMNTTLWSVFPSKAIKTRLNHTAETYFLWLSDLSFFLLSDLP